MNNKIKFLELVLADLISERDTLEMDLNYILNNVNKRTQEKKSEFNDILEGIVRTNNKIKTLTEYLSQLTPPVNVEETVDGNNNN